MKKFKNSRIFVIGVLTLLLVLESVCLVMAEEDKTVSNSKGIVVGYYEEFTSEQVSALRNVGGETGKHEAPDAKKGYVFAGWYGESDCHTNSALTNDAIDTILEDEDSKNTTFYAKFVSGDILNVKGQLQGGTDSTSEQAILRFVTTVDGVDYQEVGFNIKLDDKSYSKSSDRVYMRLYEVGNSGEKSEILPIEFHDGSLYFMAVNLTGIPAESFGSEATAVPYWITCDGTVVENTDVQKKSVVQGMPTVCEALVTNASGVKQGYYSTLEKAFTVSNSANFYLDEGDTVTVIQDNVEIAEQLYVYESVTLTNEAGRDVVVKRAETLTEGSFIDYTSNLTVKGIVSQNDGTGALTFDGDGKTNTKAGIKSDVTTSNLSLDNITIKNIVTTQSGGAVRSWGKATITGCKFENNILNQAGSDAATGAAVYHRGNDTLTVSNCIFTSNKATADDGGALYVFQGDATISGSRFESNSSAGINGGGAIYVRVGTTTISDTDFISNSAISGGAVYIYKATKVTINETCEFSGNSAKNGGALYAFRTHTTVSGSTFTSNTSTEANGGAIYFGGDTETSKTLKLTSCTFESNNTATTGNGGAVYMNYGTATVSGSTFENNGTTGADLGGAIYVNEGETTISDTDFSSNEATSKGGAVYDHEGVVTIKETCSFSENRAAEGGALYDYGGKTEVSDSSFTSNVSNSGTSNAGGGAIHYRGESATTKLKLTRCTFTSNEATGNSGARAGAVYIYRGGAEITGSRFTSNGWNATTQATTTVNGGAIYVRDGKTDIIDTDFEGNKATSSGGAVYINLGTYTVEIKEDCTFSNNRATQYGGAIYNLKGQLTVDECTLTSNTVETYSGGAIYVDAATATLEVSDSAFTSNRANITTTSGVGGGAIFTNAAPVTVSNSDFDENVGRRGGAIYENTGTVTIENGCMFSGNTAVRGGAVYISSDGTGSVTDTMFIGNGTAELTAVYGGAIHCANAMTIDGCVFDQNSAKTSGAAGYSSSATFNVTNTTLVNQAETDFNAEKLTLLTQANESTTTNSVDNIHDADDGHQLSLLTNIDEAGFEAYCNRIESMGFVLKSENTMGEETQTVARTYYSTERGYMLHTYWVEYSQEVRTQVAEMDESMLAPLVTTEYTKTTEVVCTPLFHQLEALSYDSNVSNVEGGMGYIVRLTDGRFVVVDGGTYLKKTDATSNTYYNNAYEILKFMAENTVLKDDNGNPKVVIATWMFTHAHDDHIGAFEYFVRYTSDNDSTQTGSTDTTYYDYWLQAKVAQKTGITIANDGITLESIMFNPCDTEEQMTYCSSAKSSLIDSFINVYVPGTPIYKPLTGQEYRFADTSIEILHTMSDFLPKTISQEPDGKGGDYNVQTVVSMVDVDCNTDKSDKYFIMGDTTKVACDEMSKRYGTYMESDYVQVAHHGYNERTNYDVNDPKNSRRHGATKEIYELILKDDGSTIVMWPTSDQRFADKTQTDTTLEYYIAINDWLYRIGQPDASKHWIAQSVSDVNRTIEFK